MGLPEGTNVQTAVPTAVRWPLLNVIQVAMAMLWTALWVTLAVVASILTLGSELPLVMARRCWAPGLIFIAGQRLKVDPLPKIDWSQPHIFVMNHQSTLDIPVAFAAIPANLRFVAKHSLAWVPFLGWYMAMTGMIFINRSNRRQAVRSLRVAGAKIRSGKSIIMYPEGTRSKDLAMQPFKKGPFALAIEAGVPVVPVVVEGSGRSMPRDTFHLYPGVVRVRVGTPIPTSGYKQGERDRLLRDVRDAMIRQYVELGGPGGDEQAIADEGIEGRTKRPPPT